ncbi:MAG: disulfide oxidoreductase [Planctomycetes bacterium]|nr:disulfide oxidoreductase [Planctomycetota bacterium]
MQPSTSEPQTPLTGDTPMAEAMRRDPDLAVKLMRFHIGGCSLCGFEPDDTIAQVAEDNGVPLAELLAALNAPR